MRWTKIAFWKVSHVTTVPTLLSFFVYLNSVYSGSQTSHHLTTTAQYAEKDICSLHLHLDFEALWVALECQSAIQIVLSYGCPWWTAGSTFPQHLKLAVGQYFETAPEGPSYRGVMRHWTIFSFLSLFVLSRERPASFFFHSFLSSIIVITVDLL